MFLLPLLLTGCPEAPSTTDAPTGSTSPGAGATPGGGAAGGPPGQGGAGGASGAAPGGGPSTMPTVAVEAGTGVKVSGEFAYSGSAKGKYRIDFFTVGTDGRPMIVDAMTLDKPGPFELELPKAQGKIDLLGFIDAEGNGPQLAEPSALLKDVDVEETAITGLKLDLVDGAPNDFATDSKAMLTNTPSNPPPTGAGGAAGGQMGAGGAAGGQMGGQMGAGGAAGGQMGGQMGAGGAAGGQMGGQMGAGGAAGGQMGGQMGGGQMGAPPTGAAGASGGQMGAPPTAAPGAAPGAAPTKPAKDK